MTWTDPLTWNTGDLVTAVMLNEQIRDNMTYLKNATAYTQTELDTAYSTTSTSWVDVDSANLKLEATTSGGLVLVGFEASIKYLNADIYSQGQVDFTLNGNRLGGNDGLLHIPYLDYRDASGNNPINAPYVRRFWYWLPALATGTHTLKTQWRRASARGTSLDIINTANGGIKTRMWLLELAR